MVSPSYSRFFGASGCLTPHAFRSYLSGSVRLKLKFQMEEHLRHCRICSEAMEGFRSHHRHSYFQSDLDYLSGRLKHRYARNRTPGLSFLILFSAVILVIILVSIFYIIRQL